MRWLRGYRPSTVDVVFFLAAVALGVHSFALPFGDDQGLYYYVAREWRHGGLPYRDVFDHKPPGIYVVYRWSMALFGEHLSSIRVADLLCVLALGPIVARLAVPRGQAVPRGLVGVSCAIASLAHYGFFDFWTTAQTEIWYTTLGIAALTATARMDSIRRAAVVAGLLTGIAFLLKPPSVAYTFVAALVLVWRAWRGAGAPDAKAGLRPVVIASAQFLGAAAAPIVVTLLYFWMRGGLPALIDITIHGNSHYARTFRNATSPLQIAECHLDFFGFLSVPGALAGGSLALRMALGLRARNRFLIERSALGFALVLSMSAAVTMQQKFFGVHWVTAVGPLTFALVALVDDARLLLEKRSLGPAVSFVLPVLAVFGAYMLVPSHKRVLSREQGAVIDYVSGRQSREEFAKNFFSPPMNYYQVDIDAVSDYLLAHARAGDAVCVRGFSPQIYAQTGMRFGGRFFWTNFIYPPLSYRRADYHREDREAVVRLRPRFIVAVKNQEGNGNIDSAETYYPLGYRLTREFGSLQILERNDPS